MRSAHRFLLILLISLTVVQAQAGSAAAATPRLAPPLPGEAPSLAWHHPLDPPFPTRQPKALPGSALATESEDVMIVVDLIHVGLY